MGLARATAVAGLVWLAACQSPHRGVAAMGGASSSPSPEAAGLPRLWVFYGGETEPFCMWLGKDGTGRFFGGFVCSVPQFDEALWEG
jgi:hypothetical protein